MTPTERKTKREGERVFDKEKSETEILFLHYSLIHLSVEQT